MSDTPETDAVFTGSCKLPLTCQCLDLCRRLERERDELRRLWHAECAESRKLEADREYNAGLVEWVKNEGIRVKAKKQKDGWIVEDAPEWNATLLIDP